MNRAETTPLTPLMSASFATLEDRLRDLVRAIDRPAPSRALRDRVVNELVEHCAAPALIASDNS